MPLYAYTCSSCGDFEDWQSMTACDQSTACPRCGHRLKTWSELSEDERMLAERLSASAEFPIETRKKHRFCTRCWYEAEDTERAI